MIKLEGTGQFLLETNDDKIEDFVVCFTGTKVITE